MSETEVVEVPENQKFRDCLEVVMMSKTMIADNAILTFAMEGKYNDYFAKVKVVHLWLKALRLSYMLPPGLEDDEEVYAEINQRTAPHIDETFTVFDRIFLEKTQEVITDLQEVIEKITQRKPIAEAEKLDDEFSKAYLQMMEVKRRYFEISNGYG